MATKKQKRTAALAKHEAFMDEMRRSGLEAQRKDHEEQARRKKLKAEQKTDEILAARQDSSGAIHSLSVVFSGGRS